MRRVWLAKEGGAFLLMGAEPLELWELCGVGPRERCRDDTEGGPLNEPNAANYDGSYTESLKS